jgi:DNA-binding NarL/FixJ family response regulator
MCRLMIVDDFPGTRAALRQIAEANNHEVVGEAENGKEALALIPQLRLDLVLMDVSMPVMGGFETAQRLRLIAPELPIIFISQHTEPDYVAEAFRLGARAYLVKSACHLELNDAIESVAANKLFRSAQLAT